MQKVTSYPPHSIFGKLEESLSLESRPLGKYQTLIFIYLNSSDIMLSTQSVVNIDSNLSLESSTTSGKCMKTTGFVILSLVLG
jgi:hypothetical protein